MAAVTICSDFGAPQNNCRVLCLILFLVVGLLILAACQGSVETTATTATTSAVETSLVTTATSSVTTTQPMVETTVPETTVAQTTPMTTEAVAVTTALPTEEEWMALEMVATILDGYGKTSGKNDSIVLYLKENYGTNEIGYLWTNFSGVGMQYYLCKLNPSDSKQQEIFRQMIENFKYYRQSNPSADAVKYHSARGARVGGGSGDCFFDDNIWVARNYLRAYEILGDAWYLEEAVRVYNWVLSGWNDTLGGIVWSERGLLDSADEQHLERGLSANACAIMVSGELAALAENEADKAFYLAWAERFYTFCKRMQNTPQSYDYWNGIHTVIVGGERKDGAINKVHYSYNSGSMILADLVMYRLCEDGEQKDAYLQDAIKTVASAKKTFYRYDPQAKCWYYTGDPWFAAILCEAYYELFLLDASLGADYMETFSGNVKAAYQNRDTASGLCPYQATQSVTWTNNEIRGLHQIGYAEQAVLVALYQSQK